MANQAAKKQKQKNDKHLSNLRLIVLIISIFYILFRVVYYYDSFTWLHGCGALICLVCTYFCYSGISSLAECTYDENGELIFGGNDLTMPGFCEYYHDVIYLCLFVEVTTALISDFFWLVLLIIPLFAIYKIATISKSLPQPVEDEASRKKREKKERQASRPKFVRART